jgi:hypothetical protein
MSTKIGEINYPLEQKLLDTLVKNINFKNVQILLRIYRNLFEELAKEIDYLTVSEQFLL